MHIIAFNPKHTKPAGLPTRILHMLTYQPTSLLLLLLLQVYSPSLVVTLAVPDFSMPYNVICLTSTVLAVFLGAVVGALLLRPAELEKQAHASVAACAAARKRKRVKVVLLLVVFGGLGLYLDPSLQEAVVEQLQSLGLS
jgi:phosphatidylinositol glycan class T